jgi:hypothetical protein
MFIDPSGRLVNYHRLRASNVYTDLCEMSNRLTTISLENVTENERKTFFISNYYLKLWLQIKIFDSFKIFIIY